MVFHFNRHLMGEKKPTYQIYYLPNLVFLSLLYFFFWYNKQQNAGACTKCTAVAGAATDATFTCTTATNSRFATGLCKTGTLEKTKTTDQAYECGTDTCTATCAAGSYAAANVCTFCAAVANAATGATYTCTAVGNSRVSACASDAFKTPGATDAAADTCTTCTNVVGKATGTSTFGTDGAITCTSASDSRVANCIAGKFKTVGAAGAIDVCTTCTAVTNFATVTCTSATNSVAATCDSGFFLVSSSFFSSFFLKTQ